MSTFTLNQLQAAIGGYRFATNGIIRLSCNERIKRAEHITYSKTKGRDAKRKKTTAGTLIDVSNDQTFAAINSTFVCTVRRAPHANLREPRQ